MLSCTSDGVLITFKKDTEYHGRTDGECSHKYEIVYVVSGHGKWIIDGTELPLEKSTVYIFKPIAYYVADISGDRPFERYSISFSRSDLHDEMLAVLDSMFSAVDADIPFAEIKNCPDSDLERILSATEYASALNEEQKKCYLSATLSQLLVLLSASVITPQSSSSDSLSSKISEYISHSVTIGRIPDLDEIADRFFISKYYLCRLFKKQNGTSVHSYINQKRIMLARGYMDSGMSAQAAADMVGYADYSAFYRAYVKATGSSPKSRRE